MMKKLFSINLSFNKQTEKEEKHPNSTRDTPSTDPLPPTQTTPRLSARNRSTSLLNLINPQDKSPRNTLSDKKLPTLSLPVKINEVSSLDSPPTLKSKSPRNWTMEIQDSMIYVEPSQYIINFDEWMKNPCSRVSFEEYLTERQNSEQMNFINHIDRYRKLQTPFGRYEDAKGIYHNYISPECFQQINISSEERREFQDKFKDCNSSECPCTIFDNIYASIYSQLKHDSFPRYQNSFQFQEFCRREPELIFERNLLKKK